MQARGRAAGGAVPAGSPAAAAVAPAPAAAPSAPAAATDVADGAALEARARRLVTALGGADNIRSADAVALTRLRVVVRDESRVDQAALRAAGAHGVMVADPGVVHVLVGLDAARYVSAVRRALG
jgi:glucose-like phosphotransferase system IIB component